MKKISLFLGFSMALMSCGQSDGLYTVKVKTGLENLGPAKNLMSGLSHQMFTASVDSCMESDVFAAIKTGPLDTDIQSFPIKMLMDWTGAPNPLDINWLTTHTSFAPIQFKVPAGLATFGIVGPIVQPTSGSLDPVDGVSCKRLVAGAPVGTSSIIGHNKINITGNTTINLNTWALSIQAQPAPNTSDAICASTDPNLFDQASQKCPERNFFSVLCTGPEGLSMNCPSDFMFEYLISSQNPGHPKHFIGMSGVAYAFKSVPNIDPMLITPLSNAGIPILAQTFVVNRNKNQQFNRAWSAPIPGGNMMLTESTDLGMIVTQEPNTSNFSVLWNPISGATNYQVGYATGNVSPFVSPGSFTGCGGPTAGTTLSNLTVCNGFTPSNAAGSIYTVTVGISSGSVQRQTWALYSPVGNWGGTPPTLTAAGLGKVSMDITPYSIPTNATTVELKLTNGAGSYYAIAPVSDFVGSVVVFKGIPAGIYTTTSVRAINTMGGSQTKTGLGSVTVP